MPSSRSGEKSPVGTRLELIVSKAVRIAAAPHAAFRKLGGEGGGVLLHLESTAYFRVNELGATIWQIVQDEPTFDELVRRVSALVHDPPADLEDDIARFVDELTTRQLLVIEPIS